MKKALALLLSFGAICPATAAQTTPPARPTQQQQQQPPPSSQTTDDDDVVRITTSLVQTDVVVTDRDGRQVTDLKAEDFEILENGKPQNITNFSYVSAAPAAAPAAGAPTPPPPPRDKAGVPPPPPARLRPEQVRRAIALVVDDLRMSHEGVHATRQALKKYVDEQVQPGDLVAIIRTSAGIGALQQFTNDRQQLYAAIERVRPLARSTRLGAFTSVDTLERLESSTVEPMADAFADGAPPVPGQKVPESFKNRSQSLSEFRDTLTTVGTLGALNFVIRGLKELPGRKAVVLFSDGIAIFNKNPDGQDRHERVLSALRNLIDLANRASVVIYPVDTRGLQPTGLTAADMTSGQPMAPNGAGLGGSLGGIQNIRTDEMGKEVLGARAADMFEGQNGLNYLARETGGTAVFNQNDLNKGIRRALDDIRGYYLIGYRPEDSTFDPETGRRKFNTWTINVKGRDNLKVRTRSGFLGVAEDGTGRKRTRAEQLMAALLSPFASGGVKLQLTSFFLNDASAGSTIRSVMLMDARDLTFKALPDGRQQAVMDVIAVTLGEDGQIVDQVALSETIIAKPAKLERFMNEGMLYGMNVPVRKPGAYQLRIAVRDSASGRVGSASQYVEVPDVKKDKLTLSSLVITGNRPATKARDLLTSVLGAPGASAAATETGARVVPGGEGLIGMEDPLASPASRVFRHGWYLDYACLVLNAGKLKKGAQLNSQVKLFREGQQVFTGDAFPVDLSNQADPARLVVARRLQLGTILEPGDYVLQLTITDSNGNRTATRFIDFKLVN
ncbi:MAG: VWA domain-containing protein [Pyrinomonadaceae bacterium]